MKKINLAITGCRGRMGQKLIDTATNNKSFKLVSLTENFKIKKKINNILPTLNCESSFKKSDLIIDFTIPECTMEVLKIASKLKKKSCYRNNWFYKKSGKFNKKLLKKNRNTKGWKYEFRH